MVEITDQVVRTVRIENNHHQHHHGHRRRRIIIRVPPFLLIWAILFHSERIHPILHIPNSVAIKDWFYIQQYNRHSYPESSTVPSSNYLDEWIVEDEKKHQHQKQHRNPCQRPGNYNMRT